MFAYRRFLKSPAELNQEDFIQFFPVPAGSLENLQSLVAKPIPEDMLEFWTTVGQGYAETSVDGRQYAPCSNRVLSPAAVIDLLKVPKNGRLSRAGGLPAIPFFEIDEGVVLAVMIEGERQGEVVTFKGRRSVSGSVREFFDQLAADPLFYAQAVFEEDILAIPIVSLTNGKDRIDAWLKKCADLAVREDVEGR